MSARQIHKLKISDSDAEKMFDAISNGFKHATNLPIHSLSQDNAKTRRRQGAKARNFRALPIEDNSTQQLRSERWIPPSVQRYLILLVHLETRVGQALR